MSLANLVELSHGSVASEIPNLTAGISRGLSVQSNQPHLGGQQSLAAHVRGVELNGLGSHCESRTLTSTHACTNLKATLTTHDGGGGGLANAW
jgi:hypothetical protein